MTRLIFALLLVATVWTLTLAQAFATIGQGG